VDDISYTTDSDGNLNLFKVERDDEDLWLNGNNGNPENFWNSNKRFVFVGRKSLHFSPAKAGEFFENPPFVC